MPLTAASGTKATPARQTDTVAQLPMAAALFSLIQAEIPREQCVEPNPRSGAEATEFVVLSRFTVDRMIDEVKQAFRQRPHQVDHAAGFVRMEVLSPCDAPDEIWLFTHWKDESSYRTWHHSHLYQESHQGIPKGLRLVPQSVSIRFFEHVAS